MCARHNRRHGARQYTNWHKAVCARYKAVLTYAHGTRPYALTPHHRVHRPWVNVFACARVCLRVRARVFARACV